MYFLYDDCVAFVIKDLVDRADQHLAVVRRVQAYWEAEHKSDWFVPHKLKSLMRAIAGYMQFVDLWQQNRLIDVLSAYEDKALIFQGRE